MLIFALKSNSGCIPAETFESPWVWVMGKTREASRLVHDPYLTYEATGLT